MSNKVKKKYLKKLLLRLEKIDELKHKDNEPKAKKHN